MSRIAQQKPLPRVRLKITRRGDSGPSSRNLSDDDGYSAVEELSESDEDDEDHINAAEEEHIISNATRKRSLCPPRPHDESSDDAEDADGEYMEADEDDDEDEDEDDDGVGSECEEDGGVDAECASWNGIVSDADDSPALDGTANGIDRSPNTTAPAPIERRVRFTGVPDSESDSTTTDLSEDQDGFFPDIFVEQGSLDPAFRREIEFDEESNNSTESFWDFYNSHDPFVESEAAHDAPDVDEPTPTAEPTATEDQREASIPDTPGEAQELDGYETDGDTTEEDDVEPIPSKKSVTRLSPVEATTDSELEQPIRFRRGQPRVGRFNLDASDKKPIAVLNPKTGKMMIFTTPQKRRQFDLVPETFHIDYLTSPDVVNSSPIFSNSASLMMSAMVSNNTFGDFMNTQPFGPAEAFFPFAADTLARDDSDEFDIEDEPCEADEAEEALQIEDFITFHHDSSDEDDDEDDDAAPSSKWNSQAEDGAATPTRTRVAADAAKCGTTSAGGTAAMANAACAPSEGDVGVHPLLNHFNNNSDAVGAFRRNQINQQLIFSDKASQESLAFSGGYYHGTLRGIKSGRMETVTTPITPARRQKRTPTGGKRILNMPDTNSSPLAPVYQKRKGSSSFCESTHKRQRRTSDMEVLQI